MNKTTIPYKLVWWVLLGTFDVFLFVYHVHAISIYDTYALIAVLIIVNIYSALSINVVARMVTREMARLTQANTIVSLMAIIGLIFTVVSLNSQQQQFSETQQQQQQVQIENESAYLQNSQVDIDIASTTVTFILQNIADLKSSSAEILLGRFSFSNLQQLINDPALSPLIRKDLIHETSNMEYANSLLDDLAIAGIDRNDIVSKLQAQAQLIQTQLPILSTEMSSSLRFSLPNTQPTL